jgi:glycosyltransferase involved in cell wall biosynthesis
MSQIKISVITAVFNSEKTISDALESVLGQVHPFVETVVIDGGSTDRTMIILDHFRSKLNVVISEKDNGIYDALNKGISHSSGDIIGFLHSDDVFEDEFVLSKVADVFKDPSICAVYGDLVYVRRDDLSHVIRYWNSGLYDITKLSRGWMPPHPTFYVRRSVYDLYGVFDTQFRISADYDSILRFLAINKINISYIPEVLIRMRSGGISNRSLSHIVTKSLEDFRILKRNKVGGIYALFMKNLSKFNQFF